MNIHEKNLCFLDLETTGFEPKENSIIEISFLVKNPSGEVIRSFDKVIIPDKSPLTDFISELTGITQKEIDETGIHLDETVKKEIQELIGDAIIIGHNIDFDIRFLEGNGISCEKNGRIDTHELSRIALIGERSYALEVLSKKYGFAHKNAHRAMSDVEVSSDLYYFLLEKIKHFPKSFIEEITPVLETKTNWIAKDLFLRSEKTGQYHPKRIKEKIPGILETPISTEKILESVKENPQFIRAGISNLTGNFQKQLAENSDQKTLIITDKFDYFEHYEMFPTPEVLLDPEKIQEFEKNRTTFTDQEITLYLQICFRNFLGFRGKNHMDMYFQQYNFWKELHISSEESNLFKEISQEKMNHKTLVLSPAAYVRFVNTDLFSDRTLIVDEAELLAEKMLLNVSKKFSLLPFLNSEDEKTSVAAQFWMRNFCQDVLRIELGHELSPFPVKQLLPEGFKYTELSQSLEQFDDGSLKNLKNFLENPEEKLTRWCEYNPKSGNLEFGVWHPDWWRKAKENFCKHPRILFHRHTLNESNSFFRIFTGTDSGDRYFFPEIFSEKEWIVPDNLVSAKSPDFNTFCANEIANTIREYVLEDSKVGVLFSSLESLRKIYLETNTILKNTDYNLLGERVTGGKGKISELLNKKEFLTVFFQKMRGTNFENNGFETLILQKFLFSAPHPLFDKIDSVLKSSRMSFWDTWTIPFTAANISRKIADFPEAKRIICFDGRENASWGKQLLKSAFPEISKLQ